MNYQQWQGILLLNELQLEHIHLNRMLSYDERLMAAHAILSL